MIDLHSHTNASDGEFSPDVLFALARQAGVTVLAVTDHDTISALAACAVAAKAHGVRLVSGIEVSTRLNRREVHILGHFVDPGEKRLATFGDELRIERRSRMERMVTQLNTHGVAVRLDRVLAIAGDAHLGRPHLARALMDLGVCATLQDAFNSFLGPGCVGYVERREVTTAQAIALIRGAGGAATVAHPGISKVTRLELEAMRAEGLAGLEVFHSDHPPSQREKMLEWATELDLVPTAGSDFHGPTVSPKRQLGTESMSKSDFERLFRKASTAQ